MKKLPWASDRQDRKPNRKTRLAAMAALVLLAAVTWRVTGIWQEYRGEVGGKPCLAGG